MFAATECGKVFHLSPDMVRAITGHLKGKVYLVTLFELPHMTFKVEALNADAAQAAAVATVCKERPLRDTGAIVRFYGEVE